MTTLRNSATVDEVVDVVARVTRIERPRIMSPFRGKPEECLARWIAMYVWYHFAPVRSSWSSVGRDFDRDRTSVRHGVEQISERIKRVSPTALTVQAVLAELR